MKSFYKILEVNKDATQEDIRKSYLALVKKYHPDNNDGNEEKFKEIVEAYEILSDLEERKKYDKEYNENIFHDNDGSFKSKEGMFEDLFSDNFNDDYEEYITFLRENEDRAKNVGRTLKKYKDEAFQIPKLLLYEQRRNLEQELNTWEENYYAVESFIDYLKSKEKNAKLCDRTLQKIILQIEKNKITMTKSEVDKLKGRIDKELSQYERNRELRLNSLVLEFIKRDLDFSEFLKERNLTKDSIPLNAINSSFELLSLLDEMKEHLSILGITMNEYLEAKRKTIIQIRYKELLSDHNLIVKDIEENKNLNKNEVLEELINSNISCPRKL